MILLVHLLFGAAIASAIKNVPLAIVLAFLSHYFLDFIPHIEYSIENIEKRRWQKSFSNFLKITLDFCFGILLISMFSGNQPIVYIGAFFAILPDGFSVLNLIISNKILKIHNGFHKKKIHFLKNNPALDQGRYGARKISIFWRILSQITIIVISIFILKLKF
jgi:hypothetical protein